MKRLLAVLLCVSLMLGGVSPALAQSGPTGNDGDTPYTVSGVNTYFALSQLSLSVNDLPNDFEMAENGWFAFSDLTHPLNAILLSNLDICAVANSNQRRQCQFTTEYVLGISGFSTETTTFIGNYLYSFPSHTGAEKIFEEIARSWDGIEIAQQVSVASEGMNTNQTSKAIVFTSEFDDVVYWYAALRDNNVILLLVHGIDAELSANTFASLVSSVSHKTSTSGPIYSIFLPAVVGGTTTDKIIATTANSSMWLTSYTVGVAFWTWYPHYAAKFRGSNGRYQYYSGPSGTPPGFSSWTWYNDWTHNQLLIDSSWRIANYPESHNASYYHALLDCPC